MAIKAVIGGQWGDEGKGKIVDLLSKGAEIVARYQGGANAGHTVYKEDEKIVLHQIPSGILREECFCILGNGMVVDPIELVDELQMLKNKNISTKNVLLAPNAHIVTPIHKLLDRKNEEKTNNFIGTTCKGIGPCYVDKYNRNGIRGVDLKDIDKIKSILIDKLELYESQNQIDEKDYDSIQSEIDIFLKCCDAIKHFVKDPFSLLFSKKNILIEGAQGTLLDIDHGTYPFVTSSSPFSGGISTGLGLPLTKLEKIIGIFKAYVTRVGSGPFVTELNDSIGEELRKIGKEFGATTGRPRRCGWFDAVAAKYSCMINGLTDIALTKLDILDSFDEIKVCIGYKHNGSDLDNYSEAINLENNIEPIYKTFKGWNTNLNGITDYNILPLECKEYIEFIEDYTETKISIISIGPGRNEIINRY
jgi:adenylosuccinate synthase